MNGHQCAPIWELADWLSIDAAAQMWCAGDPICMEARKAAIASAVERGDIEARDKEPWNDPPKLLLATGRRDRVQVSRTALADWAESLPVATRPSAAQTAAIKGRPHLDDAHLRIVAGLAQQAGLDLRTHGAAARLREKVELAGLSVSADTCERTVKRILQRSPEWTSG
jgi:hypothetical protein